MQEVLKKYVENDSLVALKSMVESKSSIQLEGLTNGSDSLICASICQSLNKQILVILYDREDANRFYNDLIQLGLSEQFISQFPSSFKKPYSFEEIENANVLQRAEVLSKVNQGISDYSIVITYPEALSEKVINRRSLVENSFNVNIGDEIDSEFITEFLHQYEFEKVEFVYEPGQFAIRGGIIDIFSFSGERPIRIELFDNQVESIRDFDAESQLSIEEKTKSTIVPDIQTKLQTEERQSFFNYIPEDTLVWIKDYRETVDIIDRCFDKASESYSNNASGDINISSSPELLFETGSEFESSLSAFKLIEFGKRFHNSGNKFQFEFRPQPTFHKNFELLVQNLQELHASNFEIFICCDSVKQIERLQQIFDETNANIPFEGVLNSLSEGFVDNGNKIAVYTDHQIFDRYHKPKGQQQFSKKKALTLRELKTLQTGDFIVHIDYGVGRFAGLETIDVSGNQQEALRIVFKDDDLLYVSVHALHKISKYSGKEGEPPSISKLGGKEWQNKKSKVKRKVKDIAKDLIQLYAKRKSAPGFAFPNDDYLQIELESSFIYEDTPDQSTATAVVKSDMEMKHPMDRLVCGDVGFGKTEVAIRAAFKAANSGKQVAVLVPTTILAMQHFKTFCGRLEKFPVTIDYINRFKSSKSISQTKKDLAEGKIDILIGTHRIINKDIVFKDLGLLVIDEEQKFGVKAKEKIKEMRVNVDVLTLTATPIPRTLHFSLMGARDLSIISTAPPNRRPVTTEVSEFSDEIIRDSVSHELRRKGQVFFVHNRISDIEKIANTIIKLVPEARVGIAHGQMEGQLLEKVMMRFIEGSYDVLVSTNIIESGLDIPNANTIIINRAHMFGLSDLHQMRGRVGRSNTQAYCYLLTPPKSVLSAEARKRLIALEEFSDLGDGFKVAMRDLDIRGAGNLLGSEQSGFINDMGFDMYHKILEEAVQELKEDEFKDLFSQELVNQELLSTITQDCVIETDLEILIPYDYVSSTPERLQLYSELDDIENEDELVKFRFRLEDRFGKVPDCVEELIESVKLRWLGQHLGFEKITLKSGILKCYIDQGQKDSYFQGPVFGKIIDYIKKYPSNSRMREYKDKILVTLKPINSIDEAIKTLDVIHHENSGAVQQAQ